MSDDTITVFVHNVRSLSKHTDDVDNVIIGFRDTQINPSDSTCKMMETLNFFNINFNND